MRRGRGRDLRVEKGKKKGKRWIFDFDAIKKKNRFSLPLLVSLVSDESFPSPAPRMQLTSAKVAPQGAGGEAEEEAPRVRPRSERRRRCRDVDAAEREREFFFFRLVVSVCLERKLRPPHFWSRRSLIDAIYALARSKGREKKRNRDKNGLVISITRPPPLLFSSLPVESIAALLPPAPPPPRPETLRVSDEASRSIAPRSRRKPWEALPRSLGRAESLSSLSKRERGEREK